MLSREETLAAIRQNPEVSVLVIGGGINGISTFRELALNGVDVLLVEKGDFCSGSSMASSHMLHGGIRYLENGEFRLVREALLERNLMIQNAPHYAKPQPTTIPIFKWFSGLFNAPLKFVRLLSKPAERGAFVIKIGLIFYDFFTRKNRATPTHRFTLRKKSLKKFPLLNPQIICTATYYDGFMFSPERICVELVLDTEAAANKSKALNYMSVESGIGDIVTLRDALSGEVLTVRPMVVVNAAGPWIDFANRSLQQTTQYIGGTKGSHLIIDHKPLLETLQGNEFFFENKDGRIVLILPYLGKVMMGTTDIPIENPDEAVCTEEETDYILNLVEKVFPTLKIDRSQIVFQFSGVRPLPKSDAKSAGQISRDHSIEVIEGGNGVTYPVYSLIGGKWTTFRAFGEQTADKILKRLNLPRQVSTEHLPIGGGRGFPTDGSARRHWLQSFQNKTGFSYERCETLLDRYGTKAEAIAHFICEGKDEPLHHHAGYTHRELIFLVQSEKVAHLDDLILRRTVIAWLGESTAALLQELSELIGGVLGWTAEEMQKEVERTRQILAHKHGVKI